MPRDKDPIGSSTVQQAIMYQLHVNGEATAGAIEYRISRSSLELTFDRLVRAQMIKRHRHGKGGPSTYTLTALGLTTLHQHIGTHRTMHATTRQSVMLQPRWTPPQHTPSRPGAMDAYRIPSLGQNKPTHTQTV